MKIFYNDDYTSSSYAFDTTRKSAAIAERLTKTQGDNITIVDPSYAYEATEDMINLVHRTGYILAVKNGDPIHLAESQGFTWDDNIYTMALAHNAGVVAATMEVLAGDSKIAGTLSSGLHHAKRRFGEGYCTFNGLSAAAHMAKNLGAHRILCIDFDAHCGGGTYETTRDINMTQIDLSTSAYDDYDFEDYDSRSILLSGSATDEDYVDSALMLLEYAATLPRFDFIMYNAGMDPINTGISAEALRQRERIVAEWIREQGVPAVFTMAGGYTVGGLTMDDLVSLHCSTISAFSENILV